MNWINTPRSITMTNEQWGTLICYLTGSVSFRQKVYEDLKMQGEAARAEQWLEGIEAIRDSLKAQLWDGPEIEAIRSSFKAQFGDVPAERAEK